MVTRTRSIRFDPSEKIGSVYDILVIVTKCDRSHIIRYYNRIIDAHPHIEHRIKNFKFRDGKITPAADIPTLLEMAWTCPGKIAQEFRDAHFDDLCAELGADKSVARSIRDKYSKPLRQGSLLRPSRFQLTLLPATPTKSPTQQATSEQSLDDAERKLELVKQSVGVAQMLRSLAKEENDPQFESYLDDTAQRIVTRYTELASS